MTVYELIQLLAQYDAEAEVCVSQKPLGYVAPLRFHEFEDDIVKLYGDGSVTANGKELR